MIRLPFPPEILHQHIATLGKTGSGKSSALRLIAEYLLFHKKRTAIVDPKGDWWGLKSSADGKSAGFPVITFGDFKEPRASDVPINEASGRHVAELIATGNRPAIIGFRGWMPGAMLKFWLDFAPALFNLNSGELKVIIDEIHNFAPKGKILDPQAGKSVHWTNRIMSEGRGLGLTFFIASQRAQKVHNDTLDCCETLIAMRVSHPAARGSVKDWIDGNGDPKIGTQVLNTLAELKRGEAWVWSPENSFGPERVQFSMFSTFDSFAPPQLQKKVSNAGWSEVDLEQVKEKLASVIAEAKANDPKELKAEIARLKHELGKKQVSVTPANTKLVLSDDRAIAAAVRTATQPLEQQIRDLKAKASAAYRELQNAKTITKYLEYASQAMSEIRDLPIPRTGAIPQQAQQLAPALPGSASTARTASTASVSNGNGNDVSAAHIRLLSRLAELLLCTKKEQVPKEQLAAWAEYAPRSGGFLNYLGKLRSASLIDYPAPGMVGLTTEGKVMADPENSVTTSAEMLARACRVLNGSEAKLLKLLHDRREKTSKSELAEAAGFSERSGGFLNYLGHMRTLGFVEYPATGQVKCADWLYL